MFRQVSADKLYMRGFRGSRNSSNRTSFINGQANSAKGKGANNVYFLPGQAAKQKPKLPDWMKTPETLAKEKQQSAPAKAKTEKAPKVARPKKAAAAKTPAQKRKIRKAA